jgi:hypothetical protein
VLHLGASHAAVFVCFLWDLEGILILSIVKFGWICLRCESV